MACCDGFGGVGEAPVVAVGGRLVGSDESEGWELAGAATCEAVGLGTGEVHPRAKAAISAVVGNVGMTFTAT